MEWTGTQTHSQRGLVRFGFLALLFIADILLIMERPHISQQSCWVFVHLLQNLGFECQEPPGEMGSEPQGRRREGFIME